MSNYPPGSMRGSGIYTDVVPMTVTCSDCDWEGEADVTINDWGTTGSWQCPECLHDNEADLGDLGGPDPDDARDRMMDDRLGIY